MKKIVTLILTGLVCGSLLAQQANQQQVNPIGTQTKSAAGLSLPPHVSPLKIHSKAVNSIGSRWYNYGEAADVHNTGANPGTMASLAGNYLFPDTTILANFGTAISTPWIHFIGDVFDPKSSYFNDPLYTSTTTGPAIAIDRTQSYTIDSMQVVISYQRATATTIVDTLIVEVGMVPAGTSNYYFTTTVGPNLGTDTVFFKGIKWSYPNKNLTATGKQTYKILLTAATLADTLSNGLHVVNIGTSALAAFPANSLAVSSVTFKPGYTWVANTDNISTKNTCNFYSYNEHSGSFPTAYQKRDYNASYIIPNDVLYNLSVGQFNGLYVPSFAYEGAAGYAFDHHLIYYKASCATCTMVSTHDLKQDGFVIGDSYPNPVSQGNEISLPINLSVKAKTMIVVYDILGKQIASVEDSNLNVGYNEVKLSTRNMVPGIYSVSVTVGEKVKSMRVIVTR